MKIIIVNCDARRKVNLSSVKGLEATKGGEKWSKLKHENDRIQQNNTYKNLKEFFDTILTICSVASFFCSLFPLNFAKYPTSSEMPFLFQCSSRGKCVIYPRGGGNTRNMDPGRRTLTHNFTIS